MNFPAPKLRSVLLLLVIIGIASSAKAQFQLTDKIPVAADVKIGKLANGLTYYIKKNGKPEKKIELRLVVNTGSVLEDDNQLGLAHFMEHMNFNGSKHFPKNDLVNYLQTIGVKFGADLNAYTSFDETVYILPIPAEKPEIVEKGFTVLEDWAGGALLTDDEINKERGVVLEELRSGKGADDRMGNQYYPKLFNGSKYADRLPIGKEELLKTFKTDLLRKYYRDWYRPDLMAVIVVGDIDPAEAEAKIKAHFGGLKNPTVERTRPAIIPIKPRTVSEAYAVSDKEAEQTVIQIYNYVKKAKIEIAWADYKENVVRSLYGSMINQRLRELTQKANPPYLFASSGFNNFIRGYDSYTSIAVAGKGNIKDAIQALVSENERIKKFGFTSAELERAKTTMLTSLERSFKEKDKTNSNAVLGEFIRNFLEQEPIPGIEAEYNFTKQIMPQISIADVNALTKEADATNQKEFILVTGPEKRDVPVPDNTALLAMVEDAAKIAVTPYEEKKVAASLVDKIPTGGTIVAEVKDEALGTTTLTLSNGVKITLKPTTFKNDEILMTASRLGGSSLYGLADKNNATYAAALISAMGIKDLTPVDLQKFLTGKVARANATISETTEGFSGSSNIKDFETMLQLVYLYATQPRKDEALFKSFITRQKTQISGLMQNPQFGFQDTLTKVLTQNHPRGGGFPSAADFDNIDMNRAFEIYKERFANLDGMNFTFVGSFDANTIKPLLAAYLGSLPAKPTEHNYVDLGVRSPKGQVKFTYKKGKEPKSLALLVFSNTTTYDPEENIKLQAVTEVLQIKMLEKLREEIGGVYSAGISGSISKIPYAKYTVQAYIPCGPENVDKLIAATLELIKNIKTDGPSETDLNKVKEGWRKKYEEDIKTNSYWMSNLNASKINNIDPKRILTYLQRIDAITIADVKAAANKYLSLDNYVTAVMMPE